MAAGSKPPGVSGLAVGGFTALVAGCCAAGPVLTGVLGGIGLGAVLGVGVGLVALVALTTALVSRRRLQRCNLNSARRSGREGVPGDRRLTCDACARHVAGALERAGATEAEVDWRGVERP